MATAFNPNTDANWATILTYLNMPTNSAFSSGLEQSATAPGGTPTSNPPGLNAHQKEIFFITCLMYVAYMLTNSATLDSTHLTYMLNNALYSALAGGNRPGDAAQGALPAAGSTGHGWGTSGL